MILHFRPIHPSLNMTVTKAELTREIVDGMGLTQREAKEMVDAYHSFPAMSENKSIGRIASFTVEVEL